MDVLAVILAFLLLIGAILLAVDSDRSAKGDFTDMRYAPSEEPPRSRPRLSGVSYPTPTDSLSWSMGYTYVHVDTADEPTPKKLLKCRYCGRTYSNPPDNCLGCGASLIARE